MKREGIYPTGWALVAALGVFAATPAAPGVEPKDLAPHEKKELAGLIAQIDKAEDIRAAASAYAQGCGICRNSPDLNRAYLRRMLKLGMPDNALVAASLLRNVDPSDPMPWALIAYDAGQRGKLADALVSAVKAGELGDGPSILNNLGQLVAWYEANQKDVQLPPETQKAIERNKAVWQQRAGFVTAYKRVQDSYALRADRNREMGEDAEQIKRELKEFDSQKRTMESQFETLNRSWRTARDRYDRTRRELNQVDSDLLSSRNEGERVRLRTRRDELRRNLRRDKEQLDDVEKDVDEIKKRARDLRNEESKKESDLAKLQGKLKRSGEESVATFRWDPPAVDGVVTPVATSGVPAPGKPTTAPTGPVPAAADKLDAARRKDAQKNLKLARLYISNGLTDKAGEILQLLVKRSPDIPEAAEARKMLQEIGKAAPSE